MINTSGEHMPHGSPSDGNKQRIKGLELTVSELRQIILDQRATIIKLDAQINKIDAVVHGY